MDTKKETLISEVTTLPDLSGKKTIVGTKQLRKALQTGRAKQVYLAQNADPVMTEPLAQMCHAYHIPVSWVRSMADLGRACGIDVGAAAAAVVDNS